MFRGNVVVCIGLYVLRVQAVVRQSLSWQWRAAKIDRSSPLDLTAASVPAQPSVLVGITYWQPPMITRRPQLMENTLKALRSWQNVTMRIIVATNVYSPELEAYNCEQIVRPGREQFCNETVQHSFCLSWSTVRAMREASTGGSASQLENFGGYAPSGDYAYDYYIYTESDIVITAKTFDFWRCHADTLYSRGYILAPMRVEAGLVPGKIKTTDCHDKECLEKTRVLRDETGSASLYGDDVDRNYLHMWNPYAGGFMMTRAQYADYSGGPMWNYTLASELSPWGIRETTASGLTWDPRFANKTVPTKGDKPTFVKGRRRAHLYGLTKVVSHPNMIVWHQAPMHGPWKPEDYNNLYDFKLISSACLPGRCQVM